MNVTYVEIGLGPVDGACDSLEVLDNAIDTTNGDEERGCIECIYYCHPSREDGIRVRLMGLTSKK